MLWGSGGRYCFCLEMHWEYFRLVQPHTFDLLGIPSIGIECLDQLRQPPNTGCTPGNGRALTKVPRERSHAPQAPSKSRREERKERIQDLPPPRHSHIIAVFSLHGLGLSSLGEPRPPYPELYQREGRDWA